MTEDQVQRWVFDENGDYIGSHIGTQKQFNDWVKPGWVDGPEPTPVVSREEVNEERDRRVSAGLPFNGNIFDFDQRGKDNITGAAVMAKFAIAAGAQPGDTKWNIEDPTQKEAAPPFSWIAQDNSLVVLDAHQMSNLGNAAANWVTRHVFMARELKATDPIPLDYKDDKYWPVA